MSSSWSTPLRAMFPLFWSSQKAKKQHGSPSNATNPPQHGGSTNRIPMRDIEAAVSVSTHNAQPPVSSNRTYQHDGDPFHRRTSATVTNSTHSNIETAEVSVSGALAPPPPGAFVDNLSSNVRSGNFTTADLLESKATTTKTMRGSTKVLLVIPEPKLLHPVLLKIPLHIRFALNGLLCNVLFMVAYNYAAITFEHRMAVSKIYSIVYLIFIPLGHAFVSLLVFGWPERYLASLMSNFPIGLTAIAIGGVLTGYLDSIHFSEVVDEFIRDNFTFSKMPPRLNEDGINEESQFWSSLVVLFVTSLWTYVLSIYINTIPAKSDKKEL